MKGSSVATASNVVGQTYTPARASTLGHRKVWLFRVVTVALGLLATIVMAEAILRVAGWPAPGFYVQGAGPIALRPPGSNGGAFPPGARGELRHYDYSVECRVNRFGFRDREPTAKNPDEWRVGVLGDSFVAGMGVREEDRFSNIFAAAVREVQPTASVWNLGAPNCGTACEDAMLGGVKESYGLDEVLLAFYGGNDLQDDEVWYQGQSANQTKEDGTSRFDSSRRWLREHSRLSSFLWVNAMRAWASFEPPGVYTKTTLDRYWPNTEKSIERLRQQVPQRSLTILYLPAQPEWDDAAWQQIRDQQHASDADRFVTKDAIKDWTFRNGVRFIDATPWMRKCQPATQCTFSTDPHWTSSGHRVVADGLIDYWRKRN
jgi:hypothetical protein